MPKISVIVPIYNVEEYLNRCVDSILNQTFTDFECILVDDGSPDRCPQICDEYAKKDERVKVIHKPNGGSSDARNAGIDAVKGKYLTMVDSDDWIHPQMLEILYDGIIKNNSLLSICAYEEVETEKSLKKIEKTEFEIRNGMDFLITNYVNAIVPWGKLYHKSLYEGIRYPLGRICDDEFTTYKLLYSAENIAFCDEKLYMYFVNPNGITKKKFNIKNFDAYLALKEQAHFFKEKKDERMFLFVKKRTMGCIYKHYTEIISVPEMHKYKKWLRMKMRICLLLYGKKTNTNIHNHADCFEVAYPIFMKYYWLFIVLKRKISAFIKRNI